MEVLSVPKTIISPREEAKNTKPSMQRVLSKILEAQENAKLINLGLTNISLSPNDEIASTVRFGTACYNKKNILAKGCRSTIVYRGTYDSRDCAVKRVKLRHVGLNKFQREVKLMQSVSGVKNVITYYFSETTEKVGYIAMELCSMSLDKLVLEKPDKPFSPVDILRHITTGLNHLHSRNIIHMDLKPENILIKGTEPGQQIAKITDFGISKLLEKNKLVLNKAEGCYTTVGWMPPEVLNFLDDKQAKNKSFDWPYAVDIFSLGCVFYYTLTRGLHPFGEIEFCEVAILDGTPSINTSDVPRPFRHSMPLIKTMIQHNPADRPKCAKLLAHTFLSEFRNICHISSYGVRRLKSQINKEHKSSRSNRSLLDTETIKPKSYFVSNPRRNKQRVSLWWENKRMKKINGKKPPSRQIKTLKYVKRKKD